jgi:Icc protein
MDRGTFIKTSLLSAAVPLLGFGIPTENRKSAPLRFAHLTDIHVKEGIIPESGMAKALQAANSLKDSPSFIINGGDSIMDSLEANKEATQLQWDIFKRILNENNKLPIHHCIGNHDIWGWFSKVPGIDNEPLYGKNWVVEALQMSKRYYKFQSGKWHFVVLDSTQLNPLGGYIAKIDDEQFVWLKETLNAIPKDNHICIVSHIPLLSICAGLFFEKNQPNGDRLLKRNLMHTDFMQLKELFIQHPNVRLGISGHIHLQDEIEYLGVKYYNNGAVSGNWWKGNFQEFAPAYAVMELFDDGSSRRVMHEY